MAITFTRTTTTVSATDDSTSTTTTTITGSAIETTKGDGESFRALSQIFQDVRTLFFTPTTYGDEVKPGDTVVWPVNADTFVVKHATHIRPDGVVIASRLIIAR